jgi:putative endonuclease
MTNARQRFGQAAEAQAQAYLVRRGYRLLAVNQRVGRGEIDIIARHGQALVFVEVKARRSATCGAPEDAVTVRKQRQIARLAELWMSARPSILAGVDEVRFDIVAIDATHVPARVTHLRAAFVT